MVFYWTIVSLLEPKTKWDRLKKEELSNLRRTLTIAKHTMMFVFQEFVRECS